jgi:hypothetical protein
MLRESLRPRRRSYYGLAVVLGVTVAAVAVTAQGWRSRIPTFDLLTYIRSVHALLASGTLPEYGDIGSYGSFSPPGTAWLMVPSKLLFDDPRLSEYVGTGLLHGATLLGLFLLGRKFFGTWCGCLAVLLYGLSSSGLFQAGSLWPIGRPDFFVWTVYLAVEWVTRRDARFLAAALGVWGVGMYVDMALAPVLFVLPVLWLVYRPPIRVKLVLVATALVLVVWYPYLHFEVRRDFSDIRSQLLLQYVFPSDLRSTWCNPGLRLRELGTRAGPVTAAAAQAGTGARDRSIFARARDELDERLLANFPSTPIPGARFVLLLMVLASLLVFGTAAPRAGPLAWKRSILAVAAGVAVVGVLARLLVAPFVDVHGALPFLPIDQARTVAKLVVALAVGVVAATVVGKLGRRLTRPLQFAPVGADTRLVALCLVVPWFVLAIVSEQGRPERFLWLWPLQALFLAAFATNLLPRLGVPRLVAFIVAAVLAFALIDNSFLEARVRAWSEHGWSGREARQVQVVDYVASQLDREGRDRAAIGYHVFTYPFMAEYNRIDRRYKAGADFDLLFEYRRGIVNTDTCAEGLSPDDEFRVVQTTPEAEPSAPRSQFDLRPDRRFRLLRQFGPYQVFKRA